MDGAMIGQNTVNDVNVGKLERGVCVLAGGLIVAGGVIRGRTMGTVLGFMGGLLLARGITGFCPLYNRLGIDHVAEPVPPLPQAFLGQNSPAHDTSPASSGDRPVMGQDRRADQQNEDTPRRRMEDAESIVGEASEDSFPASDPPSWTNTAVGSGTEERR